MDHILFNGSQSKYSTNHCKLIKFTSCAFNHAEKKNSKLHHTQMKTKNKQIPFILDLKNKQ